MMPNEKLCGVRIGMSEGLVFSGVVGGEQQRCASKLDPGFEEAPPPGFIQTLIVKKGHDSAFNLKPCQCFPT